MREEKGMSLIALIFIVIVISAIIVAIAFLGSRKIVDNSLETVKTDMFVIQGNKNC